MQVEAVVVHGEGWLAADHLVMVVDLLAGRGFVGVDPFFYFERLGSRPSIPASQRAPSFEQSPRARSGPSSPRRHPRR
jgi:hypothetical protein